MIYMFVYSELHSSESFSNPLPTIILQHILNRSLGESILCCCEQERRGLNSGPYSATGFQEEPICATNVSEFNITITPCVLHPFIKKEKLEAKELLYIYTSVTVSRI